MLGMFRVKHTCDNVWDGEQETLQVSRNSGLSSFDNVIGLGKGSWIYTLKHMAHPAYLAIVYNFCVWNKSQNYEFSHIRYYILHVFIEISDKGTLHLVAVIISHKIEF